MIVITSQKLVRILSFGNARAMALFPFVLMSKKDLPPEVLNHEKIHLKQQLELLLIFFYFWYFIEFFIHFCKLGSREKAYMNISFEKEAYQNHHDFNYLKNRKAWTFIGYLKKA